MVTNPFPPAAGWASDTGAFNPDIFHKEALYYLRQTSIVDEITNTDYSGEISQVGDTVHIRLQPKVTTYAWAPGQALTYNGVEAESFTMKIDKANAYGFPVDPLQQKQADIDYISLLAESAAYELKDDYDQDILAYMVANVAAGNIEGSSGSEKTIGFGQYNDFTPMDALSRLSRILTQNNTPSTGRFVICDPTFTEALSREDSKLIEVQVTGDPQSLIRDKGMLNRTIHGFTIFETNNLALNANNKPVLLAGHVQAVATAQQLIMHEEIDNPDAFGKLHRGLHAYGRQVIRPKTLALMHMNIGDDDTA